LQADGRAFRPPNGPIARIEHRGVASRLLRALGDHRIRFPGQALAVGKLLTAGGAGARVAHQAGARPVRAGGHGPRNMGLRDGIENSYGGYLFDPHIPLTIVERIDDELEEATTSSEHPEA